MIINPMFFYMMALCDNAKMAAIILAVVCGFAVIFMNVTYFAGLLNCQWEADDEEIKPFKNMTKITNFIFIASIIACIVIPSEDTLLLMQAAKLTTTDNVNAVFEALKAAMDYAITILQ